MYSADGTVASVCNGEIYNFRDLRADLEKRGVRFQTKSDTEVLPPLYQELGDDFLENLNGMFALAVWDSLKRRLILARDRMGKKPLYWTHRQGTFLFSSELKGLLAHPAVRPSIDRTSVAKYLAYQYVPAPRSIFQGIHKLGPGEMLSLHDGNVSVTKYWDVPVDEIQGVHSEWEVAEELRTLLRRAVERRLISDVPLGVFLSGGIDSSSIVAMMSELVDPGSIKTFSIGFQEKSFDESSHARRVAEHFGTDHREEHLKPADLIELLPEIASFLDEPMADNSIVPTYALSKFTRRHVTVALGGDGGDELFAGYPTFQADRYSRVYRCVPGFIRRGAIEPLARMLPASDENISFDFKVKQFLKGAGIRDVRRHAVWMGAFSPDEQMGLWDDAPPSPVFDDVESYWRASHGASYGNRLLYLYKKLYLQEDILVKVDRASMATSLEVRAPFLDPELVEFVSRLPYSYKLRGLKGKYLLKKAMSDRLPKGIARRAKKGFGVPVAKWFKKELKGLLADELAEDKIRREGFFRPGAVSKLVDEHLKGKADHRMKLWTLLTFEMWLDRWGSNA
jgi:asparagine synthase (glutamine-hydrolysing)